MRLIPTILIPCPQLCPVVEQCLTTGGVAPCQHSVVQRGQATTVFVVWRCSKGQESLVGGHLESKGKL